MVCTNQEHRKLWCVVHAYNRTQTKISHKDVCAKTPYEILTVQKPYLSHIRIFGTKFKVLKRKKYRDGKDVPKFWNGVHVGYAHRC